MAHAHSCMCGFGMWEPGACEAVVGGNRTCVNTHMWVRLGVDGDQVCVTQSWSRSCSYCISKGLS